MDIFSGVFVEGMIFLGLSVCLFVAAKFIKDFFTPYSIYEQLGPKKNVAVAMSLAGYQFAVIIVLLGAHLGPSQHLLHDLYAFVGYGILGIALLNVSRVINDRFLLRKFCNVKELVDDQNIGAGAVEGGAYIASGLVVAGAIHGEGGGAHTALAFFALSQVALVVFTFFYDRITPFDVHDEIERNNVSAGVAFGGTLVALGIILMKGSVGDFVSWPYNLVNFGLSVICGLLFLPLIRTLLDKILLPKIRVNQAIAHDQNLAVGLLEMTVAVSFAVILFFSIDFDLKF
jgi:uncharacterized membrane protein YjfL (UPF0719 family)